MTSHRTTSNATDNGSAPALPAKGSGAMKMRFIVALLAAILTVPVVVHDARAHGDAVYDGDEFKYYEGGACSRWARVTTASATCLSSDFSNGGFTQSGWARNECAGYGTVVAHHDLRATTDNHWHLDDNSKQRFGPGWYHTRSIKCCMNKSDLCYKDQVEKVTDADINNGNASIRFLRVIGEAQAVSYVDVSTHENRYEFCQENPNYIYCTENPEGDALTSPLEVAQAAAEAAGEPTCSADSSCNCGDHYCTAADCDSSWDDSTPVGAGYVLDTSMDYQSGCTASTHDDYSSSIDATDGSSQECTINVKCITGTIGRYGGGYLSYTRDYTITDDVDDLDNYFHCHKAGTDGMDLHEGGCGTTTTTQTQTQQTQQTQTETQTESTSQSNNQQFQMINQLLNH